MTNNTTVINAISGDALETNLTYFITLLEFKRFILAKWMIDIDQQLILLPHGYKLNEQLYSEIINDLRKDSNSIYKVCVFDRRLFALANAEKIETSQIEELLKKIVSNSQETFIKPIESPLVDVDLQDLKVFTPHMITSVLTTNVGWLNALEIDVHYFKFLIDATSQKLINIEESLRTCKRYLDIYCYEVENIYDSAVKYLETLANNKILTSWEGKYETVVSKLLKKSDQSISIDFSKYLNKMHLDEISNQSKELDKKLNLRLKKIKKALNVNAEKRNDLLNEIDDVGTKYVSNTSEHQLEEEMLLKFGEIIEKSKNSSTAMLSQDHFDFEEVQTLIKNLKNESTPILFTISQSIFTLMDRFFSLKQNIQIKAVELLCKISSLQIDISDSKKCLLDECNSNLKLYQATELELAHVNDLPLVYGLYLIEVYRRETMLLQLMSQILQLYKKWNSIIKSETVKRKNWDENFGTIVSIFDPMLNRNNDIKDFSDVIKLEVPQSLSVIEKMEDDLTEKHRQMMSKIDNYIKQFEELGIDDEAVDLFNKNTQLAKNFAIEPLIETIEMSKSSKDYELLIKGYKSRIRKLELLLHATRLNNGNPWSSDAFESSNVSFFRDNLPTINDKIASTIPMYSEQVTETEKLSRIKELGKLNRTLKLNAAVLTSENEALKIDISKYSSTLSNINLERDAYKETLSNLNNELARLTILESEFEQRQLEQQNNFNIQFSSMAQNHKKCLEDLTAMKHEQNKLAKDNKTLRLELDKQQEKSRLLEDNYVSKLEILTKQHDAEKNGLEDQIKSLKRQLEESKDSKEVERVDKELKITEFDEEKSCNETSEEQAKASCEQNELLASEIFDIFTTNVNILENIGLLLTADQNGKIEIKRVKGLKKRDSFSNLSVAANQIDHELMLKSLVFSNIKSLYHQYQVSSKTEDFNTMMNKINQLYGDNLYEAAVIKRFDDIELLAKKLTKENKAKINLLQKFKNEKITLKGFDVGDLALFLRTREANFINEGSKSITSSTSSFSSVDISTPPPFEVIKAAPDAPSTKSKSNNTHSTLPWAAFTAFDESSRYFFQNDDDVTKDKEWFVGKITRLQKYVAEGSMNDSFRLPKGTVWFYVTATVVSCQ